MFSPELLLERLQQLPVPAAGGCYRVAFSGGADSTALLHATAAIAGRLSAAVRAVHIDHGLSPRSQEWSLQCIAVCSTLRLPCDLKRVNAKPAPGESPEAAARAARYAAMAELMSAGDVLMTAHHRDDQAETLLFRLLRGAGPRGAAGMSRVRPFGQGLLARPLLGFCREDLRNYIKQSAFPWIDDPSNFDTDFDRNYLRQRILPLLTARWPAAPRTLARSAELFGESAELLSDLAGIDLAAARGEAEGTLSSTALKCLSVSRARNLLRHWLERSGLKLPDQKHLQRIVDEVLTAAADAEPRVAWPGGEVRRYRDCLYAISHLLPKVDQMLAWDGIHALTLPEGYGTLKLQVSDHGGLRADRLAGGQVTVGFRKGGERCRRAGRKGTRALKKLLQEAGFPPWERERLPLIFVDGELAAVADFWVCDPFEASLGDKGWQIVWERKPLKPESKTTRITKASRP